MSFAVLVAVLLVKSLQTSGNITCMITANGGKNAWPEVCEDFTSCSYTKNPSPGQSVEKRCGGPHYYQDDEWLRKDTFPVVPEEYKDNAFCYRSSGRFVCLCFKDRCNKNPSNEDGIFVGELPESEPVTFDGAVCADGPRLVYCPPSRRCCKSRGQGAKHTPAHHLGCVNCTEGVGKNTVKCDQSTDSRTDNTVCICRNGNFFDPCNKKKMPSDVTEKPSTSASPAKATTAPVTANTETSASTAKDTPATEAAKPTAKQTETTSSAVDTKATETARTQATKTTAEKTQGTKSTGAPKSSSSNPLTTFGTTKPSAQSSPGEDICKSIFKLKPSGDSPVPQDAAASFSTKFAQEAASACRKGAPSEDDWCWEMEGPVRLQRGSDSLQAIIYVRSCPHFIQDFPSWLPTTDKSKLHSVCSALKHGQKEYFAAAKKPTAYSSLLSDNATKRHLVMKEELNYFCINKGSIQPKLDEGRKYIGVNCLILAIELILVAGLVYSTTTAKALRGELMDLLSILKPQLEGRTLQTNLLKDWMERRGRDAAELNEAQESIQRHGNNDADFDFFGWQEQEAKETGAEGLRRLVLGVVQPVYEWGGGERILSLPPPKINQAVASDAVKLKLFFRPAELVFMGLGGYAFLHDAETEMMDAGTMVGVRDSVFDTGAPSPVTAGHTDTRSPRSRTSSVVTESSHFANESQVRRRSRSAHI